MSASIAIPLAQSAPERAPTPQADQLVKHPPLDRRKLHKRRAVAQTTQSMPPAAPPLPSYRPLPMPQAMPPPGPVILNGCIGATCTDANGARLQGGVGTTLLDDKGHPCVRGPVTAQCF